MKRVLFFISGSVPSESDIAQAAKIGTRMFRNASQVRSGDAVERCDGVAGAVPDLYAHLPRADDSVPAVVTTADVAADDTDTSLPSDPVAKERSEQDEWAKTANVAQLKEALANFKIPFAPNTKKADLLTLFLNR